VLGAVLVELAQFLPTQQAFRGDETQAGEVSDNLDYQLSKNGV